MKLFAPAKINLHLRVGSLGGVGFHPLVSWMCSIGLCDTIEVSPGDSTTLTCDDAALPTDERNLVMRAAKLLQRESAGQPAKHATIRLSKSIPAGGGLGGGSSDAAATLRMLNDFWTMDLPLERLHSLAAELGSDVPFFLHGPSAICTGRGEAVAPIGNPMPKAAVLVLPGTALPTPAVYRKFDELGLGIDTGWDQLPDWGNWLQLPALPLLAKLQNDLEPAAFAINPALGRLRAETEQALGRPVRMSGSGSSLFTLADTMAEGNALARSLSCRGEVCCVSLAATL